MSWLFGKKKKDSPPESSNGSTDEYIFVEKKVDTSPDETNEDKMQGTSNDDLYPSLSGGLPYPHRPAPVVPQKSHQTDIKFSLEGVPFKLAPELERSLNKDFDIDYLRLDEILESVNRTRNTNYEYDFSLEKSVLAEMKSQGE